MKNKYRHGSPEAQKMIELIVDQGCNEHSNDFANSVMKFLHKKGYITKNQYDSVMKAKFRPIN